MISQLINLTDNKRRFTLSAFFSSDQIVRDGEFSSTQLVDTCLPESISFCKSTQYINEINGNQSITCVIVKPELKNELANNPGIVVSENPDQEFYRLHNLLSRETSFEKLIRQTGIEKSARIHPSAIVEENCYIGKEAIIGPGSIILNNTYIGHQAIIGPNVVIGSDGLECKRQIDGRLTKVDHVGGVFIGDHVEIMSSSVVARDVFVGFTIIGNGTKIGPLSNIGHRSSIGENCSIAGKSNVAGSAKLGNRIWVGPSSTVSNGVVIGDDAYISIGSTVVKDVRPGQKVTGFFAVDHNKALKNYSFVRSK